jgi:hypothetical protein
MTINPKWLIGKTIAKVEMRPFNSRDNGEKGTAHDPHITFTDGSRIWFTTQETEVGEYGTCISYEPGKRRAKATGA